MRILLKDLRPSTHYLVQLRSVDTASGRFSNWSRRFDLITTNETTPPMPVTDLAATMSSGNLSVSWTAPTLSADGSELDDLKDYVVEIGPVPEDPEWRIVKFFTEATAVEFTKEDNIAAFGRYRPSLTITVRARDVLDNESDPANVKIVKARPGPPTGLSWVAVGNAFAGSWNAPTHAVDGTGLEDLDGFELSLLYTDTSNNITTTIKHIVPGTSFNYSYEQNKAQFGGVMQTAKTPITLEVRARDSVGQLSDPATATAGNLPPAKPTGVVATQVSEGIRVTWNANPDTDLVAYEIWSAGTPTGAGTLYGTVSPSQLEYIHQTVAYSQDHYLYVTAKDEFGSRSVPSDRSGPVRPKSPFTVDTDPPPGTALTATTPTRPTTEPAAVTLSWNAVSAPDLAGYHIRFSKNTTTKNWLYHDVIDKAATSTTIEGLASNTSYVFQIRSYDTMINPSGWSADAIAVSSESTLKEVVSEIQIVAGGSLRSSNFSEASQTGWRLLDSGLDILSGRVNARVVSAGTLMSSARVTHDGISVPAWSLNLEGNASMNDLQVRGKIVVGSNPTNTGATNNANVSLASWNYGGSGSQWAIKGDGTIDLKAGGTGANSLQIRNDGIVGYDSGGNLRMHLNTSGQFSLQTTNGGVRFDDNGIYGYSGATNTFYIDRNGAAYFAGQISASTGAIGGWNIGTNSLYAGSLTLRSDLGAVQAGASTSFVSMRAGYGFWAGHETFASAPFAVNTNGYLHSTYGYIGGWTINQGSLSGSGTISGGVISGTEIRGSKYMTAASGYRLEVGNTVLGRGLAWTDDNNTGWGYIRLERTYERPRGVGQNDWVYRLRLRGAHGVFVESASLDVDYSIYAGSSVQAPAIYDNGNRVYSAGNPPPTHDHPYLSTSGGTISGSINITGNSSASAYYRQGYHWYIQQVSGTGIYIGDSSTGHWRALSMLGINSGSTGYPVTSSGKSFVIPHPSPAKKDTNYLVHVSVEGPTADVFYRGEGQLSVDHDGPYTQDRVPRAVITLPDYFEDLTQVEGRTVSLTPIAEICPEPGCDKFLPSALAAGRVENGKFTVYQIAGYMHDHAKFYWEVKAVRKDIPATEVEPSTTEYSIGGDGPYTYLVRR